MEEIEPFFQEFARAFLGRVVGKGEIAFSAHLDRDALDYSLNSLRAVDDYLAYLHNHSSEITASEWDNTVLWGGAYVGEVIRRNASRRWLWIDYNDYMPDHPKLRGIIPERTISTCAFLADDSGAMTMPLNKIARFIDEGPENSVHFYASCDISNPRRPDEKHDA